MANSIINFLIGSLVAGIVAAHPVQEHAQDKLSIRPRASESIALPENVLSLRRQVVNKPNLRLEQTFRKFRALAGDASPSIGIGSAIAASNQIEYLTDVQASGNNFSLIIDTGSSDTWFVKEGFDCLSYYHQRVPFSECGFGPTFKGNVSGGIIPNLHFNITYGTADGPFLNGQMGYSDLTVAGITLPKQQIALATIGAWNGDYISSGILGLGLPGLTEAFTGNTPATDSLSNLVEYSPVVKTMADTVPSVFSLSLSRDSKQSFLALGGIPPDVKTGNFTATPILKMQRTNGGTDYFYYTIQPQAMQWNSSQLQQSTHTIPQVIVDSGTTLNLLPYEIAQSVNSMFTPHAILDPDQGGWFVSCTAIPPAFGIQIGDQVIWTDPSSMILPQVRHPQTGECATGIGYTNSPPYILGDTFMQGLVSVFDITDKMEVRFAKKL